MCVCVSDSFKGLVQDLSQYLNHAFPFMLDLVLSMNYTKARARGLSFIDKGNRPSKNEPLP